MTYPPCMTFPCGALGVQFANDEPADMSDGDFVHSVPNFTGGRWRPFPIMVIDGDG